MNDLFCAIFPKLAPIEDKSNVMRGGEVRLGKITWAKTAGNQTCQTNAPNGTYDAPDYQAPLNDLPNTLHIPCETSPVTPSRLLLASSCSAVEMQEMPKAQDSVNWSVRIYFMRRTVPVLRSSELQRDSAK
ncbi:MAG TPA: hypothetical protein PLS03_15780 [Terrimicrobiaceae bacterium]|nr:hypothetical protein [Terrimicrobiaceae bacterium]